MRKVEEKMIDYIQEYVDSGRIGRKKISPNTMVACDSGYGVSQVYVTLHSTTIAVIRERTVELYTGGWQTPTTKSRLNAICDEFDIPRICQVKGEWFHYKDGVSIPFEEGGSWSRL